MKVFNSIGLVAIGALLSGVPLLAAGSTGGDRPAEVALEPLILLAQAEDEYVPTRSRRGRQRSTASEEQSTPVDEVLPVPAAVKEPEQNEQPAAVVEPVRDAVQPAVTRPVVREAVEDSRPAVRRPPAAPAAATPQRPRSAPVIREPAVLKARKPRRSSSRGGSVAGQPDPNSASGLARLEPAPADAVYAAEVVPDRWQLTKNLGLTNHPWWDPYNQNTLKADRPVFGRWFFNMALISESIFEAIRIPIPTGPQAEDGPGSLDVIGDGEVSVAIQEFTAGFVFYQGDTTFMPPDWEFRFTPAFNLNRTEAQQERALYVDPRRGTLRKDNHLGIQELFVDKHLYDASDRYDFTSVRVGIQPFNADFRGFLFRDEQLGVRLFGNRNNNKLLYNLAWFRRIEKDTNSGLNALNEPLRKDDVFVANLYFQDFYTLGFTGELIALYNINREGDEGENYYNQNGFIERPASIGLESPRNYDVLYLGLAGDGHFGRLNLSATSYLALGSTSRGVFVEEETDISAGFWAAEASFDSDWIRYRLSALYATGDDDPFDDTETGFDAVFEEPLFAGADTSYWIGQAIPFIGGGLVQLTTLDGVLNSVRSSKEEGQSNFTNPGTVLLGVGADFDFMPQWRLSLNVNQLWFAATEVLEEARAQGDIDESIGTDISISSIYRPLFTQNIIMRASAAALVPGAGYKALYGDEMGYSVLLNLILAY